jgi:hypothetical protein
LILIGGYASPVLRKVQGVIANIHPIAILQGIVIMLVNLLVDKLNEK